MKGRTKLAAILCLVIGCTPCAYAWEVVQRPNVQTSVSVPMPSDICFADNQYGWAVGEMALVLHTEDGGETWIQQKTDLPGTIDLVSVCCVDREHVWTTGFRNAPGADGGKSVILRSADGGNTWLVTRMNAMGNASYIEFVNATDGWVCSWGDVGTIWHTEDGGLTWSLQRSDERVHWFSMDFVDAQHGWVAGITKERDYRVMSTQDGGQTWHMQYQEPMEGYDWPWHTSVHLMDAQEGWIAFGNALNPRLLHTTDGGVTWQVNPFAESAWWGNIQFASRSEGWLVVGEAIQSNHLARKRGFLYHTADGGLSWEMQTELDMLLADLEFVDAQEGWAVSHVGFILHTTDGGQTWQTQLERRPNLYDVSFVDAQRGWAVGQDHKGDGVILHTEDGGRSWQQQPQSWALPEVPTQLNAVHFVDQMHGWAGGNHNILLHTENGGQHWSSFSLGQTVYGLHFADTEHGWMVGERAGAAFIAYTQDGGERWDYRKTEKLAQDNLEFRKGVLQSLSTSRHWATCAGGLYYTADGGETWQKDWHHAVLAFYFLNDQVGWVSDKHGYARILYTENGGHTYSEQLLPTSVERVSDIYFVNRWVGWCLGNPHDMEDSLEGSVLFGTRDGGETWDVELTSAQYLHRFGTLDGRVWVVGDNGVVLYLGSYGVRPAEKLPTTWARVKTELFQNYPNPFNPETWIPYRLGADADVVITIYSIQGEAVRTLHPGTQVAGNYRTKGRAAHWDGLNDGGSSVSSGVYFYQLETDESTVSRKMVIVR